MIPILTRQEFFDTAAATWDKRYQTKELLLFLQRLMPMLNIRLGDRILDIGAGTGILIPFLLKAVGQTGHVTAIDYSKKMIELCRAKYDRFPNFSAVVQRVENLEFSSELFNAITCFAAFPHFANKKRALHEMNRVLKPNGKLTIAHALGSKQIENHHHDAASVVAQDVLHNVAKMKGLLKQAGFNQISILDKPGLYLCLSKKP